MIQDFEDRHYPLDGCFNFRDIGGYRNKEGQSIRWGRYYRAGRQDRMSDSDLARVKELGIRTQIDLRRPDEITDQGRGPLASLGAEYRNIAVIPPDGSEQLSQLVGDTQISGKRYLGYLSFGEQTWRDLFSIFAQAKDHPVLVHCTAGKDRTGVTTAFLLTVLGVDRNIIDADYQLTNRDVARQVDYVERTVGLPANMTREQLTIAAGVPESAMKDFLDGLEAEHGSALAYLEKIGINQDIQRQVREHFLEPG